MENNYKRINWLKGNSTEEKNRDATKVYCKYCGHTNVIPAFRDSKICRWCGKKIYNDTKVHFIRKMNELLNKKEEI